MTPEILKQYLDVMRGANVMQGRLVTSEFELSLVMGPDMPVVSDNPAPGGWKTDVRETPSDPQDPDPLGIGSLDAGIAFDEPEVTP